MILDPLVDLGLGQADDVLFRMNGSFTAADVQEVQAAGSLVQIFLVACRITELTERVSLDQGCSFGIIFLFADGLLHWISLLLM